MANATATIAVLWAFCFATAFASDLSISLRGSRDLESDYIDVYRCDAYNRRISDTITNKTEELEAGGFEVRICFEATRQATSNNLYILKIDDFSFTKERTNGDLAAAGPNRNLPPILRQKTVDHGIVESNDISRLYCSPGEDICAIETRLTGYFFLTSGTIMGKGSVLLQLGNEARRGLQDIRNFEDIYIEIKFTGGGRTPLPPKQKRIIIIGSVIGALLLLLCCCGIVFCCLAGICCFAGRATRDEYEEEDDIEEVSVRMEYAPGTKPFKKDRNEEDMSETESLEDDQYWDDDLAISDDEDDVYADDDVERAAYDDEPEDDVSEEGGVRTVPVALPAPPFQDEEVEEERPKKQSRRSSSKSLKKEISEELYNTEDTSGEIVAVPDVEETPRKKKKKKKVIDESANDILLSPEETPRTKKKKKKKVAEGLDDLLLSPEETPRTKKKKKKKVAEGVEDILLSPEETPRTKKKKKKRPSTTVESLDAPPIE
eukprot:CAMPEP_0116126302 /NCGR_PEP_ID=MMETSP0329-20121206/6264_1 /TAXON_ID=697910 /ORGANISM="Pseudo-nitzschia arenysensis, Strain B593" /LENGTH=488 /DNA_ID=CAMNT_0003620385 /DNA_START=50 /DNA_END=1516 /DNA_ORIENTATION=-